MESESTSKLMLFGPSSSSDARCSAALRPAGGWRICVCSAGSGLRTPPSSITYRWHWNTKNRVPSLVVCTGTVSSKPLLAMAR